MLKLNVGTFDSWIRIIVGIFVVSLALWGPKSAWAWLGLLPLATGLFRFCPAYSVCGLSTRRKVSPENVIRP